MTLIWPLCVPNKLWKHILAIIVSMQMTSLLFWNLILILLGTDLASHVLLLVNDRGQSQICENRTYLSQIYENGNDQLQGL
jgi:hypothetical protein